MVAAPHIVDSLDTDYVIGSVSMYRVSILNVSQDISTAFEHKIGSFALRASLIIFFTADMTVRLHNFVHAIFLAFITDPGYEIFNIYIRRRRSLWR